MGRIYEPKDYYIAEDVNLIDYLTDDGYELIRKGKNFVVITYDELGKKHDSLTINIDGKRWRWYAKDIGSQSSILLISELDKIEQRYAIKKLATYARARGLVPAGKIETKVKEIKSIDNKEAKEFSLPEKNIDNRRVSAYLNKSRGIDYQFINHCIKHGLLYESAGNHNAVFIGKDFESKARYAYQRGTGTDKKFVGEVESSQKEYCFRLDGKSQILRVFESPIDALSFLSLAKIYKLVCNDTLLSLGGVSMPAIETFLKESNAEITTISVCTDNDEAGEKCFENISRLFSKQYKVIDHRTKGEAKDYNELLLQKLELERKQKGMEK